jgi:histidinol-phosphate aminotransferase
VDDHRTDGDAALGQAELRFLDRGSHEFFHDALLSVSGLTHPITDAPIFTGFSVSLFPSGFQTFPSSSWPWRRSSGMISQSMKKLIRPLVQRLHAYVPGEQPRIAGLIKLNTNENPYPPSPGVLRAVKAAVDGRLRLYPNPTAQGLRERLAKLHKCGVENVIVGNGSDELLAMALRAFVEPVRGRVQWFLAELFPLPGDCEAARRAPRQRALESDFSLPSIPKLRKDSGVDLRRRTSRSSRLPTRRAAAAYSTRELDALCRALRGVVILDEAYVDFASENALRLALEHPHVLISRTFSKGYSLCFQRVGYFVGPAALIAALDKIRDSYNVNGLGQWPRSRRWTICRTTATTSGRSSRRGRG